jgi:hypothetical protein
MGLASHQSKARPGMNSFRTQLKPSCGSGLHVWQEVVCLLGQHLDTGGTLDRQATVFTPALLLLLSYLLLLLLLPMMVSQLLTSLKFIGNITELYF